MRSLPWLAALLSACGPSYDLVIQPDRDTVPVGEEVTIMVRGTIEAPSNASAELSVAIGSASGTLDVPEVTFESVGATPSGAAVFTDGRYAAENESPGILFALYDRPEEIRAQWRMICNTPGDWSLFGSVLMKTAGGAPISANGNLREVGIVCE